MKDPDCIFCRIADKQTPSASVYEDKNTFAFLDMRPSAPGHTMIVHRKHGASIIDYSESELGEILGTAKKISLALEKVTGCSSITIGINHKEEAGVKHLHIHLIPRFRDDAGHPIQGVVTNPSAEEPSLVAEKIREVL